MEGVIKEKNKEKRRKNGEGEEHRRLHSQLPTANDESGTASDGHPGNTTKLPPCMRSSVPHPSKLTPDTPPMLCVYPGLPAAGPPEYVGSTVHARVLPGCAASVSTLSVQIRVSRRAPRGSSEPEGTDWVVVSMRSHLRPGEIISGVVKGNEGEINSQE